MGAGAAGCELWPFLRRPGTIGSRTLIFRPPRKELTVSAQSSVSRVRTSLLALSVTMMGALVMAGAQTEAIANRFVRKIGISGVSFNVDALLNTVLKPASGAGKTEIRNLIIAIIALVLLTAICVFAFGIMKMMGGRRGGIEAVGQVVFALIVGIAGFSVLA